MSAEPRFETVEEGRTPLPIRTERGAVMSKSINSVEAKAVRKVHLFMRDNELGVLRVDDENRIPSYALDFDDPDLDVAVAWLPLGMGIVTNPDPRYWNPQIRFEDIDKVLRAMTAGEVLAPGCPSG